MKKSTSLLSVVLLLSISFFPKAAASDKAPIKPLPRVSVAPYIEKPIAVSTYDDAADYYLCGAELEFSQVLLPVDLSFSACVASHKVIPGQFEPRADASAVPGRLIDIAQFAAADSVRLSGTIGFRWSETYLKAGERLVRRSPGGSILAEIYLLHEAYLENWLSLSGSGLSPLRCLEARERFVFSARSSSFLRMIDSGSNIGFDVYLGLGLRNTAIGDSFNTVYVSLGASLRNLLLPLLPLELSADVRFFPGSPRFLTGGIGIKLVYDYLWT